MIQLLVAPVLAEIQFTPYHAAAIIVLAIVTGIIAEKKGHNPALWFLYGVILAPIAVLHAATVQPAYERLEERKVKRGKAKRCAFCAELVRPEARVCKHCQRDLPAGTGRARRQRG